MKVSLKKVTLTSFIIIIIAVAAYLAAPHLLLTLIEKRILHTIEKFKAEGIDIKYDSLHVLRDRIAFEEIEINLHASNGRCRDNESTATISALTLTGLKLIPIVFYHSLQFDSVIIGNPKILHHLSNKEDDSKKKKKGLRSIEVNHLIIQSASVGFLDSTSCEPSMTVSFNSKTGGLSIEDLNKDSVRWHLDNTVISSAEINLPDDYYTFTLQQISYQSSDKKIKVDSLKIIPTLNKHSFASKQGKQTDRVEGTVPSISVDGFEIKPTTKALLYAQAVSFHFNLDVFRDKRVPFHNPYKSMPVKFLQHLPFFIKIDSIKITDSYIAYEEVQKGQNEIGKVFFDGITCKITNVSNCSDKEAKMIASAKFMNTGNLTAVFTFPANADKPYHVEGTLSDFSLPKVNSMLTTAAHAEISQGTLDELKFRFTYNEVRADGTVELNYSDLKMNSLLKNKEKRNKILTFLLRLVIKKDMDENLPTDKKTGTILFYRDKRRSIFNYWWKSILSGIKSVYNLDKITDTDGKSDK